MRRLTSFIEGRHYMVDPETGCWNWSMNRDRKGYGLGAGPDARAHRSSWIFANGPIPDGKVIDHLCRNKSCINPAHLDCVRQAENVWRGEMPKLTPEIAERIRERLRAGESPTRIGEDYGVSFNAVYLIAEDRCWRVDPDAPRQPIRPQRDCRNCGERITKGMRTRVYCDEACRLAHYTQKRSNRADFSGERNQ